MMQACPSRPDMDSLSDLRGQMLLLAGILFELSLDCWLASRWGPDEVEELYRRLIRASQCLQVSVCEVRDALAMASAKLEGERGNADVWRRYNAL